MNLVGAWRLVEWRIGGPGSKVSYPFGRDAVGLLCYTPDGYMSMTVAGGKDAPSPVESGGSGESPRAAFPGEPERAPTPFLAYAGRYEVRAGQIAHDIEVAIDPALAGVVQVRELNADDDRLVLAAAEGGSWHTVIWRRS
ncbi:lipocalin-like domain-containing protein [Streptosporangium longisporum]|uniref:Lipocalin-like domain-containing protein n=1 Tax=Streptosporangium longisporum TaxID=46187 RepID=A0ABP6LC19_9ACTN